MEHLSAQLPPILVTVGIYWREGVAEDVRTMASGLAQNHLVEVSHCGVVYVTRHSQILLSTFIVADCRSLSKPVNGQIRFEPDGTTVFRSRAVYSCDSGFSLDRDDTRVCQADETWSGSAPKCVRKEEIFFYNFMPHCDFSFIIP